MASKLVPILVAIITVSLVAGGAGFAFYKKKLGTKNPFGLNTDTSLDEATPEETDTDNDFTSNFN